MTSRCLLHSALRREVIAVCAVIFLADLVTGTLTATFSLYAASLGASVVSIGLLTSLSGLTALVSSLPIGIVSDRIGRPRVLFFGLSGLALAVSLFALAPTPALLVPGRLVLGVAMVASFWIGAAYLGDIVTGAARGIAFGLFTTAMGLGFSLGSLLGGELAERIGWRGAYLLIATFGVAGAAVVVVTMQPHRRAPGRGTRVRPPLRASLALGRQRPLLVAGAANVLSALAFGGAVLTIFPLYAASFGLAASAIGTMFAIRAMVSTAVRLPSGALIAALGSGPVMFGALLVELLAVTALGGAQGYGALLGWLALDGIGYGAFLTSGQAFVAEHTDEETRGAAIGFYAMTGSIGNTIAPLALGAVAGLFGLSAVFFATGGLGLMALAVMGIVRGRPRRVALATGHGESRV